jgi:hypothetical protein
MDEHVTGKDMWEETESEAKIDDRAILVRLVFAEGLLQVPCSKIAARGGSCSSSSAVASAAFASTRRKVPHVGTFCPGRLRMPGSGPGGSSIPLIGLDTRADLPRSARGLE